MPSDFGDVLATLATTSRAMGKWRLRLDSAGQKGPEITFVGVLIVVNDALRRGESGLNLEH